MYLCIKRECKYYYENLKYWNPQKLSIKKKVFNAIENPEIMKINVVRKK